MHHFNIVSPLENKWHCNITQTIITLSCTIITTESLLNHALIMTYIQTRIIWMYVLQPQGAYSTDVISLGGGGRGRNYHLPKKLQITLGNKSVWKSEGVGTLNGAMIMNIVNFDKLLFYLHTLYKIICIHLWW